jgi:hypothetical protein
MDLISDFLFPIIAIFFVSVACSAQGLKNGISNVHFSMNIFLVSFAIGISVVVWTTIFPNYMIIISVLILAGMLFAGGKDSSAEVSDSIE